MRSDGGTDGISRDGGRTTDAGAWVLVLGVVVPEEGFGVHTDGAGDCRPVRQGRVVRGGVGRHATTGAGASSWLAIRRYAGALQETVLGFTGTAGIRVTRVSTFLQKVLNLVNYITPSPRIALLRVL